MQKIINLIKSLALNMIDFILICYIFLIIMDNIFIHIQLKEYSYRFFKDKAPQYQTDFSKEMVKRLDTRKAETMGEIRGAILTLCSVGTRTLLKNKRKKKKKK